jgi:hypothetical protein
MVVDTARLASSNNVITTEEWTNNLTASDWGLSSIADEPFEALGEPHGGWCTLTTIDCSMAFGGFGTIHVPQFPSPHQRIGSEFEVRSEIPTTQCYIDFRHAGYFLCPTC